jgi:phospholipid/cholesterol/gamma-HCH transport system permease protein
MDINPLRFLVSPRIVASLISFPLLTAMFNVIGIWGGYLSGSLLLGFNKGIYFSRVESGISMDDLIGCGIKSIVFALIVVTICCYQGYYTHTRKEGHGAKGVGYATTSAVVISCVLVLVSDYVLTSVLL